MVEDLLKAAEQFGNIIYDVHVNKFFSQEDLIKWSIKSKTSFKSMRKVVYLINFKTLFT